jgi:hypothetical protein
MMVARHEMPGNVAPRSPSRRVRYDRVARDVLMSWTMDRAGHQGSHRSLRDGLSLPAFQAFHAWLPSCSPYGTLHVNPYREAIARLRAASTPVLHYSARTNSRTTTKLLTMTRYTP